MDSLKEVDFDLDSIELPKLENEKSIPFNVGSSKYVTNFIKSILPNKKTMVEIDFQLLNNPNNPKLKDFHDERQYLVALGKARSGASGTGNPLMVFKYVLATIRDYLKENPVDYIEFVGDDEHRGIYKYSPHYFEKHFGYKQIYKNPIDGSEISEGEFWFEKS